MEAKTPFGNILFPLELSKRRHRAILRALDWCDTIAKQLPWQRSFVDGGVKLTRTINQRQLSVFPVIAARMDAGLSVPLYSHNHLPVSVDGIKICITTAPGVSQQLHTDLVAAFLQFFTRPEPPMEMMPRTLLPALYPRQYPSGRAPFFPTLTVQRRSEVFPIIENSSEPVDQLAHRIAHLIDQADWRILRDYYDWMEVGDLAMAVAQLMYRHPERGTNDQLWAMSIFRRHAGRAYQAEYLPNCLSHELVELRRLALNEIEFESPQVAWQMLEPLLLDQAQEVRIRAHQMLSDLPILTTPLVHRSLTLFDEMDLGEDNEQYLTRFLSQHCDMDKRVQRILTVLDPSLWPYFLMRTRTYGPWFKDVLAQAVESNRDRFMDAAITCSATNLSFDVTDTWLAIMNSGTGYLQQRIIEFLKRVNKERWHEFLRPAWLSRWGFVVKRVYEFVEKEYPEYEHAREMYEFGAACETGSIQRMATIKLQELDARENSPIHQQASALHADPDIYFL